MQPLYLYTFICIKSNIVAQYKKTETKITGFFFAYWMQKIQADSSQKKTDRLNDIADATIITKANLDSSHFNALRASQPNFCRTPTPRLLVAAHRIEYFHG